MDNNFAREVATRKDDEVIKTLVDSNAQMSKDMEYLKNRLEALEMTRAPPPQPPRPPSNNAVASSGGGGGGGGGNGAAAANDNGRQGNNSSDKAVFGKSIKWRDSMDNLSDQAVGSGGDGDGDKPTRAPPPPMKKIKFLDLSPQHNNDNNNPQQQEQQEQQQNDINNIENDDDSIGADSNVTSSTYSSEEDPIAFAGWARVFFQARHHRASTQVVQPAMSTTSQDTYLYLSIHTTLNVLKISDSDDRWKPPLIDPPIPLKYFYAAKVPGSRSGAALFLKNDTRLLRKYLFRFEFVNRSVEQPPARYLQFVRSGKAAKASLRGLNQVKRAFHNLGAGEERRENLKENKRRAQDAFAAHLTTLDELLRESNDSADRFVECVNARNEEIEEELWARSSKNVTNSASGMVMAGSGSPARRRRTRPPPPYWGSGFNRPSGENREELDGDDSDSDYTDEGEEDEEFYDDDHDDETFFDKVKVSTEQTFDTLFNNIVR